MHTISPSQVQVALALDNQVDVRLFLRNLLTHAVNLSKLRDVGLEEFDFALLVQFFAFCDDAFGGSFATTNDVDAWRYCVLNESFGCVLSNT